MELANELKQYVREALSAHAYPREIHFLESLPKTASGKIQRYILKNQAVGESLAMVSPGKSTNDTVR